MVRPYERADHGDSERRCDDRLVTEDRLAREDREDLRDDAKSRQHEDVNLRVTEEPEKVLLEQRRTAVGRVVEVGAKVPVGKQQCYRSGDHWD